MKLVLLHSLALLVTLTNGQEQSRPTSALAVTQLRLMNADTNLPVPGYDPLLDGATIDLSTLPTGISLTVEAITTGAVTSVRFDFAGQTRVENTARWLMCGNAGDDLFRCESNPLRNGFNGVIRATPRGGSRGNVAGTALAVKLKIVRSVRMSLNLYESPSNELIGPLVNRTFIYLDETPEVNIQAIFDADTLPLIGSVVFTLDGKVMPTENTSPYELFNSKAVDFTPWEPSIGPRTIMAVAYSRSGARGTVLASVFAKFRVWPRKPEDDGYYDDDDEYGDDDDLYFVGEEEEEEQ
jgi:hypothetical protein